MNVGAHYKVWWHYKATGEVARSNMNIYEECPEISDKENATKFIYKRVIEDVRKTYDPKLYNLRIEIKALVFDFDPKKEENVVIHIIGDQTKIKEDILKWGY